jgi:hypothetical protein
MRILFTLLILYMGSSAQPKQFQSNVHHKDFLKLVKNACITMNAMDDMKFCFKNGKYIEKVEEGSPIEIKMLEPIIFVHFNTDTSEYAIAPMSYYGGGNSNGMFYLLLVFAYRSNNAIQVSYGDILKDGSIDDIRVSSDSIFVNLSYGATINTEKFLYQKDHLINLDQ